MIDGKHRKCQYAVKAHAAEIMDIAIHQGTITSCSRDRTVQVFHKTADGWVLTQTLDDHTASVSRVLLLENGNKLLSCSADRTIVIRELCRREAINGTVTVAYLPIRTLTTKASPVHMTPLTDSTLIVSTMDRQIQKFDLNTGKSVHCFRATDESGDAVVMDAVTVSKDRGFPRARILAGISTTDKSIRLYDLSGNLIDKEWGHTEGVSDVALLEREPKKGEESGQTIVISTGTDGTIMIWGFTPKYPAAITEPEIVAMDTDSSSSSRKEMTATRPPLRRVLSRTELMDFAPKQGSVQTTRPASAHTGGSSPPRTLRRKTSAYGMNRTAGSRGAPTLPQILPGTASATTSATPTPDTTSDDSVSPSTPVFNVTTQPLGARRDSRKRTPTPPAAGRESRKSNRNRTPSPTTTKAAIVPIPLRRASSTTRARTKSVESSNTPPEATAAAGNMNGLAESLSRSLRSFRKKIDAGAKEGVKPEVMKELQRELGLTAKELGITGDKEGKLRGRSNGSIRGNAGHEGVGRDLMTQLLDTYSERLVSIVSEKLETKTPLPRERKKKVVETTGEG